MATYIIRAGLAGAVKIGRADNVEQRRRELQTANAETLHVLRVVETAFDAEPIFHLKFARWRVRGEWFEFHPDMLTFVPEDPAPLRAKSFAGAILRYGAKKLSVRLGISYRTIENWISGSVSGPQCRFSMAMLGDKELAPIVLEGAGREDLIHPEKTIKNLVAQVYAKHGADHPVFQRPELQAPLKAVIASEGK